MVLWVFSQNRGCSSLPIVIIIAIIFEYQPKHRHLVEEYSKTQSQGKSAVVTINGSK